MKDTKILSTQVPKWWIQICVYPELKLLCQMEFIKLKLCITYSHCPSTESLPVRPHCASTRRTRCKEDLNSFPPEELETPPGRPCTTLEIDVYVWHYALVVVHARNDDSLQFTYTNDINTYPTKQRQLWGREPADRRQKPNLNWLLMSVRTKVKYWTEWLEITTH